MCIGKESSASLSEWLDAHGAYARSSSMLPGYSALRSRIAASVSHQRSFHHRDVSFHHKRSALISSLRSKQMKKHRQHCTKIMCDNNANLRISLRKTLLQTSRCVRVLLQHKRRCQITPVEDTVLLTSASFAQ